MSVPTNRAHTRDEIESCVIGGTFSGRWPGRERVDTALFASALRVELVAQALVLGADGTPPDVRAVMDAAERVDRWSPAEIEEEVRAALQYVAAPIEEYDDALARLEGLAAGSLVGEWPDPQPLPSPLPRVEGFDYELLPETFRPWIEDIVERSQCPPDFCAVGAMIGVAGVVGRKVGIRPKRHDDWLVVPNLWGAAIGRPGIMKTPALEEVLRPLKRLEIAAKEKYERAVREHQAREIVDKQARKVRDAEIKKALENGEDAQSIARQMIGDGNDEPVRRRHLANDSTVEKLGELLNENPNGFVLNRDELMGFLRSLDKDGQEGARAFYLEAWNGTGRYTYDRIGRGTIDIEAAIVSIIGGIQPGPLMEYVSHAAQGGTLDDGLIQRFQLAVWPDTSGEWVNVDRWPDTAAKTRAYETFMRLDRLRPEDVGAVRDDPDDIPYLRFDSVAQAAFDSWRGKLERVVRGGDEHPAIEAHLAKYRSLVPSLALLIHLAEGGVGSVPLPALDRAIRWARYLETHARRIYGVAARADVAAAHALATKILAGEIGERFAVRDIYRNGWRHLASRDDAARAVEVLADYEWVAEEREPTRGRTRTTYVVNPKVRRGGTDKADRSPESDLLSVLSAPDAGDSENRGGRRRERV